MTNVRPDLHSLLAALADHADQVAVLERVVATTARSLRPNDLRRLVDEVRTVIGAEGAALNLNGQWSQPVPSWLERQPRPETLRFEPTRPVTDPTEVPEVLALAPFRGGFCAVWGKPDPLSARDLWLIRLLAQLTEPVLEAIGYRGMRSQQALEEHERALASRIRRTAIPSELPTIPAYRTEVLSWPAASVGGDIQFGAHGWLVVGDVSGEGLPAAMIVGAIVASLRLALTQPDPAKALETAIYDDLKKNATTVTVTAVAPEPDGRIRYLSLGHPPLLLRRVDGEVTWLGATAPPLGTVQQGAYPTREARLRPGDTLCLYSDGLTGAGRPGSAGAIERFGEARLAALVDELCADPVAPETPSIVVARALEGWRRHDDLTLVLVHYRPDGDRAGAASGGGTP